LTIIPLQNLNLFKSLSSQELLEIREHLHLKILSNGEILFKEKEVGNSFFIIVQGEIEVIKALGSSDERLLNVLGPGEFLGEQGIMIEDNLRTASVKAVGQVHVLELSRKRFEKMVDSHPAIAHLVMCELSRRLQNSNESTIKDLRKKNAELAQAYHDLKAAQKELINREKVDHEMTMARDIQMSILPQGTILPEGCEVGARMVPAREVGGDFYDIIPLDDFNVGIAIGDVAGKGVPAAIIMAQFCTLLRVVAHRSNSPREVLMEINNHLLRANKADLFVTCIYGVYNSRDGSFSYARAGHEAPVIFNQDGNIFQPKLQKGTALCIFPDPEIDVQMVRVPKGDTLLMYTDGVTDTMNGGGTFFGQDNLYQSVSKALHEPVKELCERVLDSLHLYQTKDQFDDATLVFLRMVKDA